MSDGTVSKHFLPSFGISLCNSCRKQMLEKLFCSWWWGCSYSKRLEMQSARAISRNIVSYKTKVLNFLKDMLAGKKMPPSYCSRPLIIPGKLHCWIMVLSVGLEAAGSQCSQPLCSAPGSLCMYSEITFFPSLPHMSRIVTTVVFVCFSWAGKQAKYLAHQIFLSLHYFNLPCLSVFRRPSN